MSLSPLGILHTIVGLGAVLLVVYLIYRDKQILSDQFLGKIYLIATVITAASALGIYKNGEPNAAHGLAVLTVLAVIVGWIAANLRFLAGLQKYFVALCFSSTILFHALPTATEILTRFPMDAPLVSSFEDPLLHKTFQFILIAFVIFLAWQMNVLRQQGKPEQRT